MSLFSSKPPRRQIHLANKNNLPTKQQQLTKAQNNNNNNNLKKPRVQQSQSTTHKDGNDELPCQLWSTEPVMTAAGQLQTETTTQDRKVNAPGSTNVKKYETGSPSHQFTCK